ncbi:MAG: SURF1 family protein [Pseudomonadota bacterium]
MAFRPGLVPTAMVLIALPVLLGLGTWQVQRLHWKTALIATLERTAAEAPVALPTTGELDPDWTHRRVRVEARISPTPAFRFGAFNQDGVLGHRVLQLATLADGRRFVVDRGWRSDRAALPLATPAGTTTLVGALRWIGDVQPGWMTPDNDPAGGRWYWYDHAALEAAFGAELLSVVMVVTEAPDMAGAPTPRPVAVRLPNNHLGYAVTWYGLAAVLLVIYVIYGRSRARSADEGRER